MIPSNMDLNIPNSINFKSIFLDSVKSDQNIKKK